jgi:hypothetical protein
MMKILKEAPNYAGQLLELHGGERVPLSTVFEAAKRWPHLPSIYFVEIVKILRKWNKLEEAR